MATKIRDLAGIKAVKLIPSSGGAFEICVNSELIHSKLKTGEWPDFDAIAQQVKSMVGGA